MSPLRHYPTATITESPPLLSSPHVKTLLPFACSQASQTIGQAAPAVATVPAQPNVGEAGGEAAVAGQQCGAGADGQIVRVQLLHSHGSHILLTYQACNN